MVKKKYNVKRDIVFGNNCIEFRFNRYAENLIGKWQKSGLKTIVNPTNIETVFHICVNDFVDREHAWKSSFVDDLGRPLKSSYRVQGVTKDDEHYEWFLGKCTNYVTCWESSERILDIRRQGSLHKVSSIKISNGSDEEVTDYFYVNLDKKNQYFSKRIYLL